MTRHVRSMGSFAGGAHRSDGHGKPCPYIGSRAWMLLLAFAVSCAPALRNDVATGHEPRRLPTGQTLDPAGTVSPIGQMPLAMVIAPGGQRMALLLSGEREQGVQIVDATGTVRQTLPQEAAFVGLAFTPDGRTLLASGGNTDVVYRYAWVADSAVLSDSVILAPRVHGKNATHYPAGLAVSADARTMYVAENLADSIAVVDLESGRVVQRLATGRYPYGVAIGADGTVFVSNWNDQSLSVFTPGTDGRLAPANPIVVGRHPAALAVNATRTRLFVASGSTDRIAVVDTRVRHVVTQLLDPPPTGPDEGTTPTALALSSDGTRLYVAEGDANAVAMFDLSANTSDVATTSGADRMMGRIPVGWYPTAIVTRADTLYVANGKGAGTGPNPEGPSPGAVRVRSGPNADRQYTLGQIQGSMNVVAVPRDADLAALSARVARANGWDTQPTAASGYPPFTHVIYVIKENRTYDQVFGDLPRADGDTSLVLFGRTVTPNHHALAERFGIFDRFFVNAEVSGDGHSWSTAAYVSDYGQKTVPTNYSAHGGRTYDYEGENRDSVPDDDVASPTAYLWDRALRAGLSFRDFGEQVSEVKRRDGTIDSTARRWRGTKPALDAHVNPMYAGFDLGVTDQSRMDVWIEEFRRYESTHTMPTLQLVLLPSDHTAGASARRPTPRTMVADNDLALGRMIEALSTSEFWRNTVVFVLEDDAQDGPDHVDSHRSPLLVMSAYNRPGVSHRFANTTDVVRTIEEILKLEALSQFDHFGRPLRGIWSDTPDLRPYAALTPAVPLTERNPMKGRAARESERLNLAHADEADMELFNRILWETAKGESVPYPGTHRMSGVASIRSR